MEVTTYIAHHAISSHVPTLQTSQDLRSATATAATHLHSVAVHVQTGIRSEAVRAPTTVLRSAHVAHSEVHATMEVLRLEAVRAQMVEAEATIVAEAMAHSEAVAKT